MPGATSEASALASRAKRVRPRASGSTSFTATSRPVARSRPRYTVADPPRPAAAIRSKRPATQSSIRLGLGAQLAQPIGGLERERLVAARGPEEHVVEAGRQVDVPAQEHVL